MKRILIVLAALALWLQGCASTGGLTTARNAETRQDYDSAVAAYTAVLRKDPDNKDARLGLDRARLRASQDHFARGRRLAATGKLEEALIEYQIAAELTPANGDLQTELRAVRTQLLGDTPVLLLPLGRQDQDRQVLGLAVRPQLLEHIETTALGQHHVKHEHARPVPPHPFQHSLAIGH